MMVLRGRWSEGPVAPAAAGEESDVPPPVLVHLLRQAEFEQVLQRVAATKVSSNRYRDEDEADEEEALRKWVSHLCSEFKVEGFRERFAQDSECVALLLKALGVDAKPSPVYVSDPEHATIIMMRNFLPVCSETALKQVLDEGILDRMLLRLGDLQAEQPRRPERAKRFQIDALNNAQEAVGASTVASESESASSTPATTAESTTTTSATAPGAAATTTTTSMSTTTSTSSSKVLWRPGYGTGETPASMNWLESERLALKQEKQKRAALIFECMTTYLNRLDSKTANWSEILDCLDASCFLRVTMSSLYQVTVKAVVENSQFYIALLEFIAAIASRKEFAPLLGEVPGVYRSLKQLMEGLRDLAKDDLADEEDDVSKRIMGVIIGAYEKTEACLQAAPESAAKPQAETEMHGSGPAVASQDETEIYEKEMRGELFKDLDMRDAETQQYSRHHFQSSIQEDAKDSSASKNRLRRINRELKAMKTTLPLHFGSTIVLRIDRTRPFVGQFIIFAPQNTPYDSGAFLFDFFCGTDYPNEPPKVNLQTTGQGRVRFNPNLYQTGKVCLSLLGTWRGGATGLENWSSENSSLYQVFVSIQSAILGSEFPYFNEPSVEVQFGTDEGELNKRIHPNGGYERLRVATVQHAMTAQIQSPPPGFEQVIRTHFRLKRRYIREVYSKWLIDAALSDTPGHLQSLREAVADLEKAFATLGEEDAPPISNAPPPSEATVEEQKQTDGSG